MLASPKDSYERAELHSRNYTVNVINAENDRIYLANPNGMVYSLREMGHLHPSPLRDPKQPVFGYIPPEGIPEEKTALINQPGPEITPGNASPAKPADADQPDAAEDEEENL